MILAVLWYIYEYYYSDGPNKFFLVSYEDQRKRLFERHTCNESEMTNQLSWINSHSGVYNLGE